MTRYLRVGKNPRKVLPPLAVNSPTTVPNATEGTWSEYDNSDLDTSHDVPLPNDIQSGDLLVCLYSYSGGSDISQTPTGWTRIADDFYGIPGDAGSCVYYRVADGNEGATQTFTLSSASQIAAVVGKFSGTIDWSTYPPEATVGQRLDPANNPDPPQVSPSYGNATYWVVSGGGGRRANVGSVAFTTTSTGYTERAIASGSGQKPAVLASTAQVENSTVNPSSFTTSGLDGTTLTWGATIVIPSGGDAFGTGELAAGAHTHALNDATDVGTGATTKGDLLVHDGTDYERLAVGTNDQVLTADSAQSLGVKWAASAGGSTSPLTTKGDLWSYSTADTRLGVGSDGQYLKAASTAATGLVWAASPGGSTSPLTTKGDIWTYSTADTRLGVGTNGHVLTAASTAATGLAWTAAGGGSTSLNALSDVTITTPTTGQVLKYNGSIWANAADDTGSGLPSASAKGDIAVYNGSSWVIRAIGSNDQVLTADSAQSDGVKWASAAGGSPWTAGVNDPLTSTTNVTSYSGTWSINTYLQCVVTTSTQCRTLHNTAVHNAMAAVQVEVEIPSSGFTTSASHIGLGLNNSNAAGVMSFRLRGDGKAYMEDDGAAAVHTAAYTLPSAGTWVTLLMIIDGDRYTGYIGGTRYIDVDYACGNKNGPFYPYVVAYSTGALTVRYRNLKSWSITLPS